MIKYFGNILLIAVLAGCASQQKVSEEITIIGTSPENGTSKIEIEFTRGKSFNHPSFAVWIEDLEGNYIETLYVTRYVAKGNYAHGEITPGRWTNEPGNLRRPATLPYWAHKRNIKAPDGLMVSFARNGCPRCHYCSHAKKQFQARNRNPVPAQSKIPRSF